MLQAFICHPSDSAVSADARVKHWPVLEFVLIVQAGHHSAAHLLNNYATSIHNYTATKSPFVYSPKRNCTASVTITIFMCLWAIYIFPGSVHIFPAAGIGRPILGIYKLLTDT
jgi:hypothetical protein